MYKIEIITMRYDHGLSPRVSARGPRAAARDPLGVQQLWGVGDTRGTTLEKPLSRENFVNGLDGLAAHRTATGQPRRARGAHAHVPTWTRRSASAVGVSAGARGSPRSGRSAGPPHTAKGGATAGRCGGAAARRQRDACVGGRTWEEDVTALLRLAQHASPLFGQDGRRHGQL